MSAHGVWLGFWVVGPPGSFEGYPALRYDSVGSEDFAEGEESSMGYEELEPAARICCPHPGLPCCRTGQSVRGTPAAAGAGSVP